MDMNIYVISNYNKTATPQSMEKVLSWAQKHQRILHIREKYQNSHCSWSASMTSEGSSAGRRKSRNYSVLHSGAY